MRYAVIDFETANPSLASICQVGLAIYDNRQLVSARNWAVDPNAQFHPVNSAIHGITESDVSGAPLFPSVWAEVYANIEGRPVVHHTHFDRTAATQAAAAHAMALDADRWLDSARIVRRVWPEFANAGFGLADLSRHFGIAFTHHDAAEDARATGAILAITLQHSETTIDDWFTRLSQRNSSGYREAIRLTGQGDGPLSGETCVFTGTLSLSRKEVAEMAAALGANVAPGVNKDTTIVVVGDQDAFRLAGQDKSSKHRKAEQMAASGHPVRILNETDFLAIANG